MLSAEKHPRLRGEDFDTKLAAYNIPETPPLARGRQGATYAGFTWRGNTPACAGKTTSFDSHRQNRRKHPRLRGEDGSSGFTRKPVSETPPLARGRHLKRVERPDELGNTPACAGKTRSRAGCLDSFWKHPRLRGEDLGGRIVWMDAMETPPLARGRRTERERINRQCRNTPACAGKTVINFPLMPVLQKHPRLRGEDESCKFSSRNHSETPPLARGRPSLMRLLVRNSRNTPACAGKTLCTDRRAAKFQETPPLARGRLDYVQRVCGVQGNTPACAGKTATFSAWSLSEYS